MDVHRKIASGFHAQYIRQAGKQRPNSLLRTQLAQGSHAALRIGNLGVRLQSAEPKLLPYPAAEQQIVGRIPLPGHHHRQNLILHHCALSHGLLEPPVDKQLLHGYLHQKQRCHRCHQHC